MTLALIPESHSEFGRITYYNYGIARFAVVFAAFTDFGTIISLFMHHHIHHPIQMYITISGGTAKLVVSGDIFMHVSALVAIMVSDSCGDCGRVVA